MDNYYNNELYHYGIKGMKWGVRKKYYTKDGSLNTAGRIDKAQDTYVKDTKRSFKNFRDTRKSAKATYKSSSKTKADKKQYRKTKWKSTKKLAGDTVDNYNNYKDNVKNAYNKKLRNNLLISDRSLNSKNKYLMKVSDRMDKGDSFTKANVKQGSVEAGKQIAKKVLPYAAAFAYTYAMRKRNPRIEQKVDSSILQLGQQKRKHVGKGVYRVYQG